MKNTLLYFAVLFAFMISCKTTDKIKTTMSETEIPLIDREIFFGNAEISSGDLSPDGSHVAFLKEYEGIMNIWVKSFDADFDDAVLLTKSKSPILGFFWTRDSKYILYVNDNDGDENMNIFKVNPKEATKNKIPASKNLTALDEVTAQIYMVSRKDPNIMMIGLNDRDKAWHDLYKLEIAEAKLTKVFENTDRITGWTFDWDEKARFASRTDENGFSQILRVDEDGTFHKIYETNLKESAYVAGWNEDNSLCYLVSNKGDVNLTGLYMMDPNTGETTLVETDPAGKVDFGGLFLDHNTRKIISTSYTENKTRRYWRDKKFQADFEYLESKFPDREIGITSMTKDYNQWLVALSGDKYATEVYYFDRKTKDLIYQYTPKPKLKEVEQYLASMQAISYPSSDGLMIPGYLSLPRGNAEKNLPLVVLVHGGPKGPRDHWGYHPYVQFLTNRGYAVLQPNFRASGGYGKAFLNAGDKQWGKLMQDDITWGVKHLISKGIADPDRVAIMGGSYGGYATLAGMAFTPDVYACGVDIVGPSNLFTLLESIPPYWEAGRKWLYEMVGDPDTEEGARLLREASPLFAADQIKKPLMIIQGANDPRVKKAESDQIVIALRDKNQPVSYLLAHDEGHGFRKPLNRKAMMAEIEKFLAQHIHGRYQEDIPQDVLETLKKLQVDISTVTYAPEEKLPALSDLSQLKAIVTPGTYQYEIRIKSQAKEDVMAKTRQIIPTESGWKIKDMASGPMGDMMDEAIYDTSMKIKSRTVKQGGMEIPITYDNNQVSMTMMGKEMHIKAEGVLLCEGAGLANVIAGLGLKPGDATSFYIAELSSGKAKQFKVVRRTDEHVNGRAVGAYHLAYVENENETIDILVDQKTGNLFKSKRVMPTFGNIEITETLIE